MSLADELDAAARGRFVRWDARLWRELVDGPALELARGLDESGERALRDYLRLAAEAVGLGYLFPASAGRESFFTLAWRRLIPACLPAVPIERRPHVLAALWNLAESLEVAPVWLARVFYRLASGWRSLVDLEETVREVERRALGDPEGRLSDPPRAVWTHPASEDRHFLPGRLHFVAPSVICVHDRVRPNVSQGLWVAAEPLLLGALACDGKPRTSPATGSRWRRLAAADGRYDEPFSAVSNPWRAASTLVTSQMVVVLMPP